jgi:hypothetical protein
MAQAWAKNEKSLTIQVHDLTKKIIMDAQLKLPKMFMVDQERKIIEPKTVIYK